MERVHRTYWIVRQRYRRAGYVGSVLAVLLCAVWLVPMVHGAEGGPTAASDPVGTVVMLVIAALVPVLLARLCWRLHRRRYLADIYTLGVI